MSAPIALHRDPGDPDCSLMIERWSNQANIDFHANGPAFTVLGTALEGHATLRVVSCIPIS